MSEVGEKGQGVLCLGASAGGLRSLEAVLAKLPSSFPWPILVSQHLQREHASLLPEILARATTLTVREATEGEMPAPGVVHTCPSSAELGLAPDGRMTLRPPVDGRPQRIDHLFSTASFAHPGLVIAVVLSGTGTDGTAGSLVVKLNGGTVIAESDESAQYSGMPRAALHVGSVDSMRSAGEIAPLVLRLAEGGLQEMTQTMRLAVGEIAETLASSSGTDFTHYRAATLRRRIQKRCALVGVTTLADYHALVKRDPVERAALVKSLLLPVTEFFRDPAAWEALATEVLPALVERAIAGETIRVWSAGCASGEEAYSMAIALAELGAPLDRISILATDLDRDSLLRATEATYDAARMENVNATRRAGYFEAKADAFRVIDDLRHCVEFRMHDVTRDPVPSSPFDVVVCRNVLIYFDEFLQKRVLASFEGCIAPGGTLFLGRSTTIPATSGTFEPIVRKMRIFRRRPGTSASAKDEATVVPALTAPSPSVDADTHQIDAISIEASLVTILVVDASWRISIASTLARESIGADIVGQKLLDVFPRWQGSPVHEALRSTMATGRSVRVHGVPMPAGFMELTIEAVRESEERMLFLVATPAAPRRSYSPPARAGERVPEDEVGAVTDELQTTNEELAAANEELAAANEELAASNEELAALNEETQSTNQNLASTNAQMQSRHDNDVHPAVKQLHAILLSRKEAIIACDASRLVTFMTPEASTLLGAGPGAYGLPLDARELGIPAATLDEWLDAAAKSGTPIERDVPASAAKKWVSIEALVGHDGSSLGWLLTWKAAKAARVPDV